MTITINPNGILVCLMVLFAVLHVAAGVSLMFSSPWSSGDERGMFWTGVGCILVGTVEIFAAIQMAR